MRFLRFILLSFSICTCAAFVLEQPVFAQDEEEIEDEEEEYIEEEDTEEEYSEEEIEEEVEEEVVEPEEDNEEELAEEEEEPEEAVEDIEDDEEGEESGEQVEEEEEVEASPIKATLKEDEKAFESPVNVEERTELYNSAREFETKIETALDEMDKHIETFDGIHQKLDEKLDAFHIQVSDSIGALQNIADRLKLYLNKKEGVFSVRPISKKDDQVKMLNALLEELKVAVELYEKDVEKLRSKMELVATKEADIINLLQNANEKRNDARKKTVEAGIAKRNILKSGMDGKAEVSKIKVIEKHISEIKGVLETDISQKINSLGDEVGDQINEIESENIKLKDAKWEDCFLRLFDLGVITDDGKLTLCSYHHNVMHSIEKFQTMSASNLVKVAIEKRRKVIFKDFTKKKND